MVGKLQEKLQKAPQQPGLSPPPVDAVTIQRGNWNDVEAKKLLEIVAYDNLANWTGHLDWLDGGTAANKKLAAVTVGFCDNIVLKCLFHPSQIHLKTPGDRRTQTADKFFGLRCAKIREIVKKWGIDIKPDAVTGARLFRLGDQKEGSRSRRVPSERHINANTVPGLPAGADYTVNNDWNYQHIKVSLADADLQTVIEMVRSGAFAKYGLWLNDFDITIDCAGVVDCQKLKAWMLKQKNIFLDGEKVTREDLEDDGEGDGGRFWKKIMKNTEHVGLNCLTWTMEKDGYFLRVKVYLKLAQEFEKQSVRATVGNHQNDWIETRNCLLAEARDATASEGLMRSETTIYTDTENIDIAYAHLEIPKTAEEMAGYAELQLDIVPSHLVQAVPHSISVANWCNNIKHTLIVVDRMANVALVALAKNEITHTVSGVYVTGWERRSKYILQRLSLGEHPVDVIYLLRGSPHQKIVQQIPEGDEAFKKVATKKKKRLEKMAAKRAESAMLGVWVDADTDPPGVGQKRPLESEEDAEDDESEGEEGESDDEMQEAGEEAGEEDAYEGSLDREGAVAAEIARMQEQHRLELNAARAAANDDATTVMDDAEPQYAVPPGGLVAYARRYHRVALQPGGVLETELPPRGGLEHYFQLEDDDDDYPELLPLKEGRTEEQKKTLKAHVKENERRVVEANRSAIETLLKNSGFRPPANTILVQPRIACTPVSNKIKHALIVDSETRLELDLNSVLGARRRESFALRKKTIMERKEKLLKERLARRVAGLEEAAAERVGVAATKAKTVVALVFKSYLASCYSGKPSPMPQLPFGSYEVVGIKIKAPNAKVTVDTHDLFLKVGGSVVPYGAENSINRALKEHEMALAHLYNDLDEKLHGRFYMKPTGDNSPIGVLKKSDPKVPLRAANGRPQLDLGLTIGDLTLLQTMEDGQAGMEESDPDTPTPLHVTEPMKRTTPYLSDTFPVPPGSMARSLQVLKLSVVMDHHHERAVLEVKELHVPNAEPVIVWGGPVINNLAKKMKRDAVLVVRRTKTRSSLTADLFPSEEYVWTKRLPKDKKTVPILNKEVTVAAVGEAAIGAQMHRMVMDTQGKVWRFASHAVARALNPSPGGRIDPREVA